MKRKAIALFGTAAVLSALGAPAAYAAPPPPRGVTIETADVSGPESCEEHELALSDDRNAFTITYSDFYVAAGGHLPWTDRKRCSILLRILVPSDYTFGINRVDYRGSAELAAGAKGLMRANIFFKGVIDPPEPRILDLKGPYSNNWTVVDEIPPDWVAYRPCGDSRGLYLDSELRVERGSSDPSKVNVIALDSTDGSIKTTYHFAWKTCPK
ncbi:DUF4360 domain-containing protein [Actinomadura decatromicini]|uniref:DUF4360 domain-containing protein n=1 Tax=Actinomadura decatromicini TaxID=2604572 RepID=A0A5D3FGY4_9ACTN|nr:DUF4360 domain-containing protein [Actinomadura decatromicini]TYK47232.1 DUF4360 domain-containing protein [Actinomadura decatromicini]